MENMMNSLSDYIKLDENEVRLLNPLIWAYIGDAVYEVYVRSFIITHGRKTSNDLHKESIKYVKAKAQSDILEELLNNLTEDEQYIVKRTRNTKSYHVPKNADVIDYRRATAFEGLVGYLYLIKNYKRLDEIMKFIFDRAAE
jgi:ribonuclease-3 family protein